MSSDLDPPLVVRVEAPKPGRPRPGFVAAVVWCLAFLAVQITGAVVFGALVFGAYALGAENPGQFVSDQLSALGKGVGSSVPADERPPVPSEIGQALAWGMLGAQVVSLLFILVVVPFMVGRDWKRQIGIRRPAWGHVLLMLLVLPGFMILPTWLHGLLAQIADKPMIDSSGLISIFGAWPWWLTVLTVGIGPGVVEELWCRGFLGRGLCARYGLWAGVLITSLFFGFLHLEPIYALVTASMGAYLHFVFLASRSIWVPIGLHALNNGLGVLMEIGQMPKPDPPEEFVPVMYLASFALLVFVGVALWVSRARVTGSALAASEWTPEYPGISAPPANTGLTLTEFPELGAVNRRVFVAAVGLATVSVAVLLYTLTR